MRNAELMSIGEASRITGMHVKSLRYYDRMKVFTPEYVDPKSGYRYYSFDQLQQILAVRTCLDAGIILSDFDKYRSSGSIDYSGLISDAKENIDKEIRHLEKKKRYLEFIQEEVKFNDGRKGTLLREGNFGSIALWRSPISEEDIDSFSRKETFVRLATEAAKKGFYLSPLYFGMMMTIEAGERKLFAIAGLNDFLYVNIDDENIFCTPAGRYRRVFSRDLDVRTAEKEFPDLFAQDYDKIVITTVSLCSNSADPVYSMFMNLP